MLSSNRKEGTLTRARTKRFGPDLPLCTVVQDAGVDAIAEEHERATIEMVYRDQSAPLWRALVAYTGNRELANDALGEAFAQRTPGGRSSAEWRAWFLDPPNNFSPPQATPSSAIATFSPGERACYAGCPARGNRTVLAHSIGPSFGRRD